MLKDQILLPDGSYMPRLGQGTWQMAEDDRKMEREIAGLRHGFDVGFRMIDTAEMYADGKAELLVGKALKGYDRAGQFIVTKVYPENANRRRIRSSLDRSLALLGTDYADLSLLHWRGEADLSETVACLEELKASNHEFILAARQTRQALDDMNMPEVHYFIDNFLDSFTLTLDELK